MAWYKVDDQLHTHPKARRAGLAAMGLWTLAGSHSMCYLTDGFVEAWFVESLPDGPSLAGRLVEVGMWDQVDGGWQFHDWAKYQPTREQVLAERAATAERKARWKAKRDAERAAKQGQNDDGTPGGTEAERRSERRPNGVKNNAPSPSPSPSPQSSVEEHARIADAFERAYAGWPKKVERKRAEQKFTQLCRKHDPEWLTGRVLEFGAAYAATTEKRFVPALDVWLNGERWTDESPLALNPPKDDEWAAMIAAVPETPCQGGHRWLADGTCMNCVERKERA